VRATIGGSRIVLPGLLTAALALSGCAHRDVVDTPVGWWHQLQGGAIAEQRPPPPGVNDPYPRVGTTPAHAPAVASIELRRSVTAGLMNQRNLTTRIDANSPIPEPAAPPRPAPSPAPVPAPAPGSAAPAAAAGASSATLDAAQAPAGPAAAPPVIDAEPELALPAVQVQAVDTGPVTMPAIPGAPPPPPRLPGLALPVGLPVSARLPDYQVAPPSGTVIAFAPGTDTMLRGQQGALHAIAARRAGGSIVVYGYGDASAPDPDAQAQALSVATLRARTVAEALQGEGVPARSILLRAEAFGRGASVNLLQ
jgi:outer membrane protein OmpA-like peptidoglycan-associated protein